MAIDCEEIKGKIRGVAVLIMTPFKEDSYELDTGALKENIRFVMDRGISDGCIVCPCGTGEMVNLSHEEHKMVVEAAVEVAGNKLAVIAGTPSCDYREVIELAKTAAEAGAMGAMIPPPYYTGVSQEGLYRWYEVISEGLKTTKIGIVPYDQPTRNKGGIGISSVLGKLAELENIVALKYGYVTTVREYLAALGLYAKRFSFMDNSTGYLIAQAHALGARGWFSPPGAWWPEFELERWNLLEQGKYDEALKWQVKIIPFWDYMMDAMVRQGIFWASIIKAALEYRGLYGGPVRPPEVELTKEQKEKFFGVLEGMGVPKKR